MTMISAGCTSLSTDRDVIVETKPSSSPDGITPTIAMEIFRDLVEKLKLISQDPIRDSRTPDFLEYTAQTSKTDSTNQLKLSLLIDKNNIEFICEVYGTNKDVVRAEKAAALITQALNERGVKYKIHRTHDSIFWGA